MPPIFFKRVGRNELEGLRVVIGRWTAREAMDGGGAHGKQLQARTQAAEMNGDEDI